MESDSTAFTFRTSARNTYFPSQHSSVQAALWCDIFILSPAEEGENGGLRKLRA